MRINLTDNNTGATNQQLFYRKDIAALFPITDKTIAQLCKENKNLLIFPYCIEGSDDEIGDAYIFTICNTENPETVRISTGNIMGFIGVGNVQLKFMSRFDNGQKDYLLHYMLQRVLSLNLFNLKHNNEREDVFDIMMFMFPYFLKKAMRQGLYKEYKSFLHNDANIKGTVNLGRHIAHNIPFVGNIAYSTREYAYDNDITELIRHTIEFMKTKEYGASALNIDSETVDNVKTIMEHTTSYNKYERRTIINRNLRHKSRPYYTEYKYLQSLCLQILRLEEVKFGDSDDEICGILFDGAWLWEEYVNTILKSEGFFHPENKKHKGGIYLFEDRSGIRYPDFYKEGIVLDAKYKRLENYDRLSKVGRDDLHQIITYVSNLKATKGGFIVPLANKRLTVPQAQLKNSPTTLFIFGIEICSTATSYADFCSMMKENERRFIESIKG